MLDDAQARFDAGASAWTRYNQRPLGRIRHEVTWHNLAAHLPHASEPEEPLRVLDAGGGSGEMALRLAQGGYRTWLLDYAPAMLDQARQAAQALPAATQARLTFCLMPASEAGTAFPAAFFDAIVCHTLIEYLASPRPTLRTLVGLLRPGGLLSLSFVNRHAEVMRQVLSRGDPVGALAKLEGGDFCAGLFDLAGRAYTAQQVGGWLEDMGLCLTDQRGVRVFADYVPVERLDEAEYFEALLHLEIETAAKTPYCFLARYVQLLAHKKGEGP